ncbi:hypothetical protein EDD86DRAFT_216979 [Gorgonomyces haynaldii]|nr:hypothetical protein EDD86DRAFT_216979 [Gorgonomyces haynaldii]
MYMYLLEHVFADSPDNSRRCMTQAIQSDSWEIYNKIASKMGLKWAASMPQVVLLELGKKNLAEFSKLLDNGKIDPKTAYQLLFKFVEEGEQDLVNKLLQFKPDLNHRLQDTKLMQLALEKGMDQTYKLLKVFGLGGLQEQLQQTQKGSTGYQTLMQAVRQDNLDNLEQFLSMSTYDIQTN